MEYSNVGNKEELISLLSKSITNIATPKFYYSVIAQDDGFLESNEKLILYKMAYLKLLEDDEVNDVMLERIQDRLILKAGQNLSYAFSKNCGVMLYTDFKNLKENNLEKYKNLVTNYNQNYFDIFLLTIHQRYTLLYLEGELANMTRKICLAN